MTGTTALTGPSTGAVAALACDVRLAEAAEQARAGDYRQALATLDLLPADHPDRLDLVARIHAQCGSYAAAEAAWREVLRVRPDDAAALRGCALISRIRAGRRLRRPVPITGVAAGAAVLGVALLWPVTSTVEHGLELPRSAVVESVPEPEPEPVPDRGSQRLDDLARSLTTPDVVVERGDSDVRVTFREGLFGPDDTDLTPAGRQTLERWAAVLAGRDVRVTVLGHTATVPGGPTAGGSPVALARAGAAAEVLAAAGGLPLTTFVVGSADQSNVPHPTDQTRNRTVTLLVVPQGG
ncbi:OmpA family protein [Saccharothrix deserti]|uniref:OmpA family protein n=1 Tax=Saccharothrix deserti TaxID=2593674 RepID=UPI00131C9D08|nr:OmpA family protein [Saccharothrix deserti]